jgi:non-specific serine/threonine protein kinase
LLADSRLVTITGPGGAGKTRLAEEFAAGLARSFENGSAVAYLAGALAPVEVAEVVAAAVGLRSRGARGAEAELISYLGDQRLLLVLDNCEHLAAASAALTAEVLRACARVAVVATGRQPLHLPGEQLFPIGGLGPEAAIELFADRARRVVPGFAVDEAARPQVEQICGRLDGMPLAIELAAAQVRSLGLAELTHRLAGHLPDLASRSTVGPERQRTLRQAIAWSHDLLGDAQRIAWRRLSVFSGGFTLDAAQHVAGSDPIEPDDVPPLLGDLVDQSMLIFEPAADRYRLIEVLREFGHEQLVQAGEASLVAEWHRRFMVGLAEDCDRRWFGPDQARLIDAMHAEAGNLRSALENCRAAGAAADGLRLANGAFWYWLTRASLAEGLRWYRAFLGRSGDAALEAQAHRKAAYLATLRLDFAAARELLTQAFGFAAAAEDPLERAFARLMSALVIVYERPGRSEDARRLCGETLEDPAADTMARQWALIGSALASLALADWQESRRAAIAGADIGRHAGELWGRELSLRFLAHAEWQLGHHNQAEAALVECLHIDRQLGDLWHMAWSTEALGWVAADTGRFDRGARLLGIAAGLWAQTGSRLADPWQAWHAAAMGHLCERLGTVRLAAAIEAGRALTRAEALAFALQEARPLAAELAPEPAPLSARELEVAALVADGLGNRAIAERLFLSPRTVEKHIEHMMDKLALGSRAEIAAWHARRAPTNDSRR